MNKHTLRFIWGLILIYWGSDSVMVGLNSNVNLALDVVKIAVGLIIAYLGISYVLESIKE